MDVSDRPGSVEGAGFAFLRKFKFRAFVPFKLILEPRPRLQKSLSLPERTGIKNLGTSMAKRCSKHLKTPFLRLDTKVLLFSCFLRFMVVL